MLLWTPPRMLLEMGQAATLKRLKSQPVMSIHSDVLKSMYNVQLQLAHNTALSMRMPVSFQYAMMQRSTDMCT